MDNNAYLGINIRRRVLPLLAERLPAGWTARESAIRGKGQARPDLVVEVRGPGGARGLIVIEVRAKVEPMAVAAVAGQLRAFVDAIGGGAIPVLVAPFLSPRTRQRLDAAGVGYGDLAGNLRIVMSKPALYIETQGAQENPDPDERSTRSLKGAKAGRIVRSLCDCLPPHGVRKLAERVGVDPGYVSRVLAFLQTEDVIVRERRGPITQVRWRELIQRWAQDYSFLGSNEVLSCLEPRDVGTLAGRMASLKTRYAITGTLAAATVAPVAPGRLVAAYVDDPQAAAERLDLRPAETGANVLLARPCDEVVFERGREQGGVVYAALAQVAADLLTGPGRGPSEAAALLDWMEAHESDWRS